MADAMVLVQAGREGDKPGAGTPADTMGLVRKSQKTGRGSGRKGENGRVSQQMLDLSTAADGRNLGPTIRLTDRGQDHRLSRLLT
jgi:hypothetical protein